MNHKEEFDVGVIVGRFQVPSLHSGHRELIEFVRERHSKVIIFLGLSPVIGTRENPLDFEARKQLLLSEYPDLNVLYIKDTNSDYGWSHRLDAMVDDLLTPAQSAVLYGARDSFIRHYEGKFETRELEAEAYASGTAIRAEVSRKSVRQSADFRAGVVWASFNRYPTCFPTVDVAVFNEDGSKILLGRKETEVDYRFIGGFADPTSQSYEADARREVQEEAGVTITDPVYVGSTLVDDWRYRRETDKIKTLLFRAKLLHGAPRAADDLAEVRWFPWDVGAPSVLELQVVSTHVPLLKILRDAETKEADHG